MWRQCWRFIVVAAVAGAAIAPASASEIQEGADHPLVGRFEGSEIVRYGHEELTEYPLIVQEVTRYGGLEENLDAVQRVAGELTRITYETPEEPSTLEVFRAYREALTGDGFRLLFECSDAACGGRDFNHASPGYRAYYTPFGENYEDQRYLAAHLSRDGGDVHVAVHIARNTSSGGPTRGRIYTQVDVVEEEPGEDVAEPVEESAAEEAGEDAAGQTIQEVDLDFCRCRKMHYLDAAALQRCQARFGDLDEERMAEKTAGCRQAASEEIEDPFADALADCTPYRGTFRHPMTGQPLEREIEGLEQGTCRYREEMPQGGRMRCAWPETKLQELATWYRYADFWTSTRVRSRTSLGEDGATTTTEVTADDVPTRSPLEESLEAGECTVQGY